METSDRLLVGMAKGLLEEAGIFFYVCGDEIGLRPGMSDAFLHRGYTIVVARDSEAQARGALQLLTAGGG